MPATKKPAARPRVSAAVRARAEDDAHRLERISQTLEAAQKDLASIGGSVGTGVRDLRRDVNRLLRDARRDLGKMRRSVQRDLERLQKDLTSAAAAKPVAPRRATTPTARTARRRTASSH
jgi:chromosome segregation ATPase